MPTPPDIHSVSAGSKHPSPAAAGHRHLPGVASAQERYLATGVLDQRSPLVKPPVVPRRSGSHVPPVGVPTGRDGLTFRQVSHRSHLLDEAADALGPPSSPPPGHRTVRHPHRGARPGRRVPAGTGTPADRAYGTPPPAPGPPHRSRWPPRSGTRRRADPVAAARRRQGRQHRDDVPQTSHAGSAPPAPARR